MFSFFVLYQSHNIDVIEFKILFGMLNEAEFNMAFDQNMTNCISLKFKGAERQSSHVEGSPSLLRGFPVNWL